MDRVNQKLQSSSRSTQGHDCRQHRSPDCKASPRHSFSLVSLNHSLVGVQPKYKVIVDEIDSSPSDQSGVLKRRRKINDYVISNRERFTCTPDTKSIPDRENYEAMQHHLLAINDIVATFEQFPGNFSKAPSVQQFTEQTARWLQHANRAYVERKSVMTTYYSPRSDCPYRQLVKKSKILGVFYPRSYLTHEFPSLTKMSYLSMHSLPEYFDHTYKYSFVGNDNGHSPSECLSAFFHGPTVADCATTLLACQYRAIETIIGTREFNSIFDAPASKFRIARSLFISSISTDERLPAELSHLQPIDIITPLISLFDYFRSSFSSPGSSDLSARKLSEADVKEGDTLYIQGVDRYIKRHRSGDSIGFNLICTGQNSSGQNLYLGFDPDLFDQPKTYDQVKQVLIDGYNRPQGPDTIAAIDRGESGYAQLTNDILSYDHPIVGITGILRFNPSRWERSALQRDKAWHRQPLMPVAQALAPVPLDNGSPFTVEHADSDFGRFQPFSSQQKSMKITALKFTHAVIDGTVEPSHKKPMGLFLTGMPGVGKTHLCVAVAKEAAEHGVKTLYIDAKTVDDLAHKYDTNMTQWHRDIAIMLAGKDLVVLDDINSEMGGSQLFLAQTMRRVLTDNIAIMASSNNRIRVKDATPGVLDPLDERAHNFLTLSDLQGDSCRSQWWQCPEVQATDELSRLGQYKGSKAAGVITEQPVSINDIARALNMSADQIRRVGKPFLCEAEKLSSDFQCRDLSKTQHQAIVLEFIDTEKEPLGSWEVRQFLNILQRVHDEGLKLIVKTNDSSKFIRIVGDYLGTDIFIASKRDRIVDRLNHMFHEFYWALPEQLRQLLTQMTTNVRVVHHSKESESGL